MSLDTILQSQLNALAQKVAEIQATSKKGRVVYTCITNGYNRLLPPTDILRERADFILFSDTSSVVEGWQTIPLGITLSDPRRTAKILKILPHKVFASYDMSLWIDGNFRLESALQKLMDRFAVDEASMLLFQHSKRDCLYEEARTCILWGKDAPGVIKRQIERYEEFGYPLKNGLFMGNFLLRKHNEAAVFQASDFWWNEIQRYSVRDQISLPFALKQHAVRILQIPWAELSTYCEILPHEKYHIYSPKKISMWYARAFIASFIYKFVTRKN